MGQQRTYAFFTAIAQAKAGNYAEATTWFAKANQADPLVWYYQAAALEAAGDPSGARKLYQRIVDLNQLDTPGYAIVRPRAMAKLKM